MNTMEFSVPCLFGLEGLAGDELRRLDIENVRVENGRVLFSGDARAMAKANVCLRTGERVLIVLADFKATTFEQLFQGVYHTNLEDYAKTIELPLILRNDYGLRPFVRAVAEDISHRCGKCYEMRFLETARQAAEGGFDSFTSSLFISPYQNHELMREVAERAAAEFGVQFLYRDFRPYFRPGQDFAREHGFYMQKYCGCVFSEEERYIKAKKIIP